MAKDTRIQKAMSLWGVCSRRRAEEYIEKGRVKVNGRPAKVGDKIDLRKDLVTLDGETINRDSKREFDYVMMNKPRGYVTTMSDDLGRKCVIDLLDEGEERLFPIGRLDRNSEGLLLLTNDGNFANLMMHPSKKVSKTYRVTVSEDPGDEEIAKMAEGVYIDGRKTAPASIRVLDKAPGRTVLEFVIREGRNRQIRKMCEAAGLTVTRLRRIKIGPISVNGIAPGTWRKLRDDEVAWLRRMAKLKPEKEMPNIDE